MKRPVTTLVVAGLLTGGLLATAGCAPSRPSPETMPLISQPMTQPMPQDMVEASYAAADVMISELEERMMPQQSILPVTFVNMDNLEETSSLGRLIARQMASRFTQRGYSVMEVKIRKDLLIRKDQGEFILSREMEKIGQDYKAKALLVGSYTVAQNRIFVSAQIIRLKDKVALASRDFSLSMGSDVRRLLGQPL
ncbi:MAG: hypothetical protein HQL64_09465 [Magnetococcales bacterium]|nr:hypothetical protein [Magnetococcales bacterium]